jgi:hypothetical protein
VKKTQTKTSDAVKRAPTAGNQDYGYLYLRYVLDVNRRQNQHITTSEDDCLVCKNGGDLVCCDFPDCPKVYHSTCLKITETKNGEFFCSKHFCLDCCPKGEPISDLFTCVTCTTSYCGKHLPHDTRKYKNPKQIICKECLPNFAREIE